VPRRRALFAPDFDPHRHLISHIPICVGCGSRRTNYHGWCASTCGSKSAARLRLPLRVSLRRLRRRGIIKIVKSPSAQRGDNAVIACFSLHYRFFNNSNTIRVISLTVLQHLTAVQYNQPAGTVDTSAPASTSPHQPERTGRGEGEPQNRHVWFASYEPGIPICTPVRSGTSRG